MEPLERNADCNSRARISAVVHVIAVIYVRNINIVVVVPVIAPVFGPGINRADPIAFILETRISAYHHERQSADQKPMVGPKVSVVTIVRNAVAVVAAALLPVAVVRVPVL
jgi:hypothetical protein